MNANITIETVQQCCQKYYLPINVAVFPLGQSLKFCLQLHILLEFSLYVAKQEFRKLLGVLLRSRVQRKSNGQIRRIEKLPIAELHHSKYIL